MGAAARRARLRREDSTVTLIASNSLYQVYNQLARHARAPAALLRRRARQPGRAERPRLQPVAGRLRGRARRDPPRAAGASGRSGIPRRARAAAGGGLQARRPAAGRGDRGRRVDVAATSSSDPDDILIVCAGGRAGSWSACLPGWGNKWTRSVTTGSTTHRRRQSMKLFDPTSKPVERARSTVATRPADLTGLRLGLVDNTKFNSEPDSPEAWRSGWASVTA